MNCYPRLQRLRALLLVIKAAANYPTQQAVVAVEFHGDVSIASCDSQKSRRYIEENKNYDPDVAFTLNSHEIVNTLVAFCDLWLSKACSKNLWFGFYTPNGYARERRTPQSTALKIKWPEKPMLEYLTKRELDEIQILQPAILCVIAEYERQAKKHSTTSTMIPSSPLGNLDTIKRWKDTEWKQFFQRIDWKFGQENEQEVETQLIDAIQTSPFYTEQMAGKERQVVTLLMDLLDKRQSLEDPTERCVSAADVLLAFKQVETRSVRLPDPTWETWESLPPPTDTRNIKDKLLAVCPQTPAAILARWSRRAASSLVEQRAFREDKQILALKYQLYDACEEYLSEAENRKAINFARLQELMAQLMDVAKQRFGDCALQYAYTMISTPSIEGIVYELLDSCYLSFDGGHSNAAI